MTQSDTMIRYGILIIIYRKRFIESETFTSLAIEPRKSSVDLFIWDNSPNRQSTETIREITSEFGSFEYFHDGKNHSLACIYNKVLDDLFRHKNIDYAIIFDHDTLLNKNHLDTLTDDINNHKHPALLVPIVRNIKNNKTISPRNLSRENLKSQEYGSMHEAGRHRSENFFAVGSGLTISRSLWESGIRFDEKLRLYGVDEEFCIEYARRQKFFITSQTEVLHNISSDNDSRIQKCKRIINLNSYRCYRSIKHEDNDYCSKLLTRLRYAYKTLKAVLRVTLP